jgi:hypothetical protein
MTHSLASHEADMPDCQDPDCEFHRSLDDGDLTEAKVVRIPPCDYCGKLALYDAKTDRGPWAFMCQTHFDAHGPGKLGLGIGQKLVLLGGETDA